MAYPQTQSSNVSEGIASWLEEEADKLDSGEGEAASVLQVLAAGDLTRVGVPAAFGGDDGDITDAVLAVADVSSRSLAAGFVLWGHRTYIEYLLQTPNTEVRNRYLPDILAGSLAGATGLSNAMKFLDGIEELQFSARQDRTSFIVSGKLPWVTNLRPQGFHVAIAASRGDAPAVVAFVSSAWKGVTRSEDLDLLALRSTNTAAISISDVTITSDQLLHDDAKWWLPQVRPAFLGLQCGMSLGLARRALDEARKASGTSRAILSETIAELSQALEREKQALFDGLRADVFKRNAAALFRIRITLADIVAAAVGLELQATGGKAYLNIPGNGFRRRWREAAFIPIITPSLVQLRASLIHRPAR